MFDCDRPSPRAHCKNHSMEPYGTDDRRSRALLRCRSARDPLLRRLTSVAVRTGLAVLLAAIVVFGPARAQGLCDGIQCGDDDEICTITDTGLPLRVLVKPDANIFDQPVKEAKVIRGNVPPFSVLHVFKLLACEGSEKDSFSSKVWYHVGYTAKKPAGFMSANDAAQWRSAMTVAYTNPGATERKRVLMFDSFASLETLLTGVLHDGKDIEQVYKSVERLEDLPEGLIAIEQDIWTDIDRNFYLMPILEFEDLNDEYPEGDFRALKVAALTKQSGAAKRSTCDLTADDAEVCLARNRESATIRAIDLVWVIDMTKSMQPYIDAVAKAVKKASIKLRRELVSEDAIRFGLVGYRDDVEEAPWLEFDVRNFTPELLTRKEFDALMQEGRIRAAEKSTGDFPEEVFAGVQDGIRSAWREDSARIIVLIGDASSHELGHRKNTRNIGLDTVKEQATQEKVYIASILIANPESAADNEIAQKQYRSLSALGGERSAFARVTFTTAEEVSLKLQRELRKVTEDITRVAETGELSSIASGSGARNDSVREAVKTAVRAAVVEYMGQDAQPPADITAWVADRDLSDLKNRSFDVRVVMTRKDVEELKVLLESLLAAVRAGSKSSSGFIEDTSTGSVSAALDLKIEDSEEFAKSELVPLWIKKLPYQSRALSYSVEAFLQLPPDDRTEFESRLEGLVNVYEHILSDTDAWHNLNDEGTETSQVYLLSLERLP